MPSEKLSPLQIALQEYSYWRDCENVNDPNPTFETIQIGAIAAAANIAGRLAGANAEGITYRTLTPEQITRALIEIKFAPRLPRALDELFQGFLFLAGNVAFEPNSSGAEEMRRLKVQTGELLDELRKAGAL